MTIQNKIVGERSLRMTCDDKPIERFVSTVSKFSTRQDLIEAIKAKFDISLPTELTFQGGVFKLTRGLHVGGKVCDLHRLFAPAFDNEVPIIMLEYAIVPNEDVSHICRNHRNFSKILLQVDVLEDGKEVVKFYKYDTQNRTFKNLLEHSALVKRTNVGIPLRGLFSFFRPLLRESLSECYGILDLTKDLNRIAIGFHKKDISYVEENTVDGVYDLTASCKVNDDFEAICQFDLHLYTLKYLTNKQVNTSLLSISSDFEYTIKPEAHGTNTYIGPDSKCTLDLQESSKDTPYQSELSTMIMSVIFADGDGYGSGERDNILNLIPKTSEMYKYIQDRAGQKVMSALPKKGISLVGSMVYKVNPDDKSCHELLVRKRVGDADQLGVEGRCTVVRDISLFRFDLGIDGDYTELNKLGITKDTHILTNAYGVNFFKYIEYRKGKETIPTRLGLVRSYTVFLTPEEADAFITGKETLAEILFIKNRVLDGRPVIIWHNENPMNSDRALTCMYRHNSSTAVKKTTQVYDLGYFTGSRVLCTNTLRDHWILDDIYYML